MAAPPLSVGVIQHVAAEGPAGIGEWLYARGHHVRTWSTYRDPWHVPPAVVHAQLLVVLGGPMSANDTSHLPWMRRELDLIREHIAAGMPVLGVCLGAQLLARALGAAVYRCAQPELGWYPVELGPTPHEDPWSAALGPSTPALTVLQWHGETFDLPPGAVHRAASAVCTNQMFTMGDRHIGMQFHCESTPRSVAELIAASAEEIRTGPYQMPAHQIRRGVRKHAGGARPLLHRVLAHLERAAAEMPPAESRLE